MIIPTKTKIIQYISKNGQASGKELTMYFGTISARAIRKQLKNLLTKQILQKVGTPPKVYYLLDLTKKSINPTAVDPNILRVINSRYLFITPTGTANEGWEGFLLWCKKTNQDPIKTASEYIETLKKYDRLKKNDLISGMAKMRHTFKNVFIDKLFYLDFYSIERFGKTKLGQMLLYAKQSQNKSLIHKLIREIKPQIIKIIQNNSIDGVLFIPPTVKREIQLMRELKEQLQLPVRILSVTKIKTEIIIPQKTLSNLSDRIENAKRTIIVDDTKKYNNILIIDDAVGSGSTLNETAQQIKNRKLARDKIIGLAITGSFKGFDVISEV